MKQRVMAGAAMLVLAGTVQGAAAQEIGVGARIGTLGVGGEVAVAFTDRFAVRGGVSFIPLEPEPEFSDLAFTVELPSPLMTLGVDFYPMAGGFRLIGGLLMGAEETTITGAYTGQVDIGGRSYNGQDLGELVGVFSTSSAAPFVGIGFGRHTAGFGLSVDLGAAFMGDPSFTLTPTENNAVTTSPQFRADLEQERQAIQEDLDKYAKVYPVLNIGLRFGVSL